MNYKDLSSVKKNRLIEVLALYIARTGRDCSALMYAPNDEAIQRIIDLFSDETLNKVTDMKGYSYS